VEKQRGMTFGFQKTATAALKSDRWINGMILEKKVIKHKTRVSIFSATSA
jgi:hypothetical protein